MEQITKDQIQMLITVFVIIMLVIGAFIVIRKARAKTKKNPKKWEPQPPKIYHIMFVEKGLKAYVKGDATEYDLKHTLAEAHGKRVETVIMLWNLDKIEKGWFRVLPQNNQQELHPAKEGSRGAFYATIVNRR